MTTYYPFTPSNVGPPSFTPTFDGSQYQVSVVWNLFGKRYYVQCVDLQGATVYNQALIESDVGIAIESLAWESLTSQVNGVTGDAHGYPLGETVALTGASLAVRKVDQKDDSMVASMALWMVAL